MFLRQVVLLCFDKLTKLSGPKLIIFRFPVFLVRVNCVLTSQEDIKNEPKFQKLYFMKANVVWSIFCWVSL